MNVQKAILCITMLATTSVQAREVNFDDAKTGGLPVDWTGSKTGSGDPK